MKQIFVRPARFPEELQTIERWRLSNPAWDDQALKYSYVWCAYSGPEIIGYMPVQRPFVMEAIVFHPLASESQKALAMKELTHTVITHAYEIGAGEIYFLGSHDSTNQFALHQGFRLIDLPLYRVRLLDLEQEGNANGSAELGR